MTSNNGYWFATLGVFLDNLERLANLWDLVIDPIGGASSPGKTPRLGKLIYPDSPETIDQAGSGINFLFQWSAVMFVTITETYIKDTLAIVAKLDPELMEKSEQQTTYKHVSSVNSIEELRADMREQWARSFVEDGGPTRWMERLTKMGARYTDIKSHDMELLWGIRHLVVHKAGIVDKEFISRYPEIQQKLNEELMISRKTWANLLNNAAPFVRETNLFFSNRYQSDLIKLAEEENKLFKG